MSLRLCDMAQRKKLTLYVMLVNFSEAYDMVPRRTLFEILRRLICGSVMLCALVAMFQLIKYDCDYSGNRYAGCTAGVTDIMFIVYHIS